MMKSNELSQMDILLWIKMTNMWFRNMLDKTYAWQNGLNIEFIRSSSSINLGDWASLDAMEYQQVRGYLDSTSQSVLMLPKLPAETSQGALVCEIMIQCCVIWGMIWSCVQLAKPQQRSTIRILLTRSNWRPLGGVSSSVIDLSVVCGSNWQAVPEILTGTWTLILRSGE